MGAVAPVVAPFCFEMQKTQHRMKGERLMKKTRLFSIICAIAMMLTVSLAGCGNQTTPADTNTAPETDDVTVSASENDTAVTTDSTENDTDATTDTAESDTAATTDSTENDTDATSDTAESDTIGTTEIESETRHEHMPVTDARVEPTCVGTGLTEGSHCSDCGETLTAQESIPATGIHTEAIDARTEPTCGQIGFTEGSHCSVCNEILTAQESIPATGKHTYGDDGLCTVCNAEKPKPTEGLEYYYSRDENAYYVSGIGSVKDKDIIVPDVYDGRPVIGIKYNAFSECKTIRSITIPTGVITIDGSAFYNCISLESITIADSVTCIGNGAFSGCLNLSSITIPDSVILIAQDAFSGCTSLIQEADGVYYVDTWVIGCDTSVTSVTLREGTTGIAVYAFKDCKALENMTIPDSVMSIGALAFDGCTSLVEKEGGVHYVGEWVVDCDRFESSLTIREGARHIANGAFEAANRLEQITIPNSVTTIGYSAFLGCSLLESIIIPNSVTEIRSSAFERCGILNSITIPAGIKSIGEYAFSDCSQLRYITFQGTTAEWHAIEMGFKWYGFAKPVYCSDGIISADEL